MSIRVPTGTTTLLLLISVVSLACSAQQSSGPPKAAPIKEYPGSRIDALVQEWTRARDFTKEYIEAMPDSGLGFRPAPEERSFAQQFIHLAETNFNFGSRVFAQPSPYKDKKLEQVEEYQNDKAALLKLSNESYDFMIDAVKKMSDKQLDDRMPFAGMNRPKSAILAAAFEHQTHIRAQTAPYLRLKGATPPKEKLF